MKWLESIEKSKLGAAGLALAVVLFFAVNIFSNAAFQGLRLDLTEGKLFTLSQGTLKVLADIDEPIAIRLFYTKLLGERSPRHATYFERVRELLERYADLSQGKVTLEVIKPEPFSDSEDRAVAAGLRGIPLNDSGDLGYFGLAGANSTDDRASIPFFTTERETFLEYDLTRIVHTLANPERTVVGLMSPLPLDGGATRPPFNAGPRWAVLDQISDFFEVRTLPMGLRQIPEDIDILMLVHPKGMNDFTRYAIDQFVLGGGRALIFVDANAEVDAPADGRMRSLPRSEFNKNLNVWGLKLADNKVAGDLDTARRVNVRVGGKMNVVDYVVWLSLGKNNFDAGDAVIGDISTINVATAGILEKTGAPGAEIQPLITTGPNAMSIDAEKVMMQPDPVALFRDFESGKKPLMLAARVRGKVKTAFPDGPPKDKGAKAAGTPPKHLSESLSPVNLIVVADVDMLHERFWSEIRNLMGQRIFVPFANNADFVVNALDNLGGSDALIGLRGRTESARPFHLVQEIRQAAERKYRDKEKSLQVKLEDVRSKLENLQRRRGTEGDMVLSPGDKAAIEDFRTQMIVVRQGLRSVQRELRREIDRLDAMLKFFNIAFIPLLLGAATIVFALFRRTRRKVRVVAE
ncbi:MAG: Gldg family protein [Proteobacteria bacterium]|nr:Gldg family protein [Pseudomonadota bacterium]